MQHAVFVEDEPLVILAVGQASTDDCGLFLRRVASFQRQGYSRSRHEFALPVGTASDSTFQWRLGRLQGQRGLKNGKVTL
ncbi:MAG: hypothetical protein VR76_03950 [Pseudomonas sp. BRH_c35]|nr:MAG: hypothetical protein VR76_03950 [Pseudomonas sp. BRH_c35]